MTLAPSKDPKHFYNIIADLTNVDIATLYLTCIPRDKSFANYARGIDGPIAKPKPLLKTAHQFVAGLTTKSHNRKSPSFLLYSPP